MDKRKVAIIVAIAAIVALIAGGLLYMRRSLEQNTNTGGSDNTVVEEQVDVAESDEVIDEAIDPNDDEVDFYIYLSNYDFYFSSGAGGWATELYVSADGHFEGSYHDSDMGDTGDDYPNGTIYNCEFHGDMENMVDNGDGSYHVDLVGLETSASEEIEDGIRYVASDAYGLDETDMLLIYKPGYEVASLSEDIIPWLFLEDGQVTLDKPIIVNASTGAAFVGSLKEVPTSYEDVINSYNSRFGSNENTGYVYLDIDNDGNDELLIGDASADGEFGNAIYDMYTMEDGNLVQVFTSAYGEFYYLVALTEGVEDLAFVSLTESSDLKLFYAYSFYDGEMQVTQAVRYSEYDDDPWTMGYASDDGVDFSEVIDEELGQAIIDTLNTSKVVPEFTKL